MLGRGCRLGIARPDVTRMQVRAVFEAAAIARREATRDESRVAAELSPRVGVMVPLVSTAEEFVHQRDIVRSVAEEVFDVRRAAYPVRDWADDRDTPRRARRGGTCRVRRGFLLLRQNDLTRMTFGLVPSDEPSRRSWRGTPRRAYSSRSVPDDRQGGRRAARAHVRDERSRGVGETRHRRLRRTRRRRKRASNSSTRAGLITCRARRTCVSGEIRRRTGGDQEEGARPGRERRRKSGDRRGQGPVPGGV